MRISGGAVNGGASAAGKYAWKTKAINPWSKLSGVVQSTYYEAFNQTGGLAIRYIEVKQVNDEVDAKTVYTKLTIDGVVYEDFLGGSIASGSYYNVIFNDTGLIEDISLGTQDTIQMGSGKSVDSGVITQHHMPKYCHSCKVEMSCESAVGTNQGLLVNVRYDKMEAVV